LFSFICHTGEDTSRKFRQRRSCLRHRATSWEVTGSIPDYIIGIFH
jgi:hypothetical protein